MFNRDPKGSMFIAGALAGIVFVVFIPALAADFLNWDDPGNFLRNESYRGLGWTQLRWMATTFHMGVYQPVSWFVLGLQYVMFGLRPTGYHLSGVLLHAGGAVVFFFVVRQLLWFATPGAAHGTADGLSLSAFLAALLFAVHPLRVESTVWVSCQPYTVCALFYLLTIHFYLRARTTGPRRRRNRWNLAPVLMCCAAALLSKAPAVSLPAVLLVLDVYPLRRLGGSAGWWTPAAHRVWLEKLPFFVLALPIAIVAPLCKEDVMLPLVYHGSAARLAHAAFGVWFYLHKTVLPMGLLPFYEMPDPLVPTEPRFVWVQVFVVVVSAALIVVRRRYPYLLAAWAGYLLMLMPNLGLLQYGEQIAADRYTHLACLGWPALGGAGFWWLWRTQRKLLGRTFAGAGFALAAVLAAMTWRNAERWQTSEKLWTYTVANTRDCRTAHENLGTAKLDKEAYDEAIAQFREVLRLKPDYAEAYFNVGIALRGQGRTDQAIESLTRAIELRPGYSDALYNLGNALFERGQALRAIEAYRRALEIEPDGRDIHHNLGVALYTLGRWDEAVVAFRDVVRIDSLWVDGYIRLGVALKAQGKPDEAATVLRQALEIDPNYRGVIRELQSLVSELDRPPHRPD